MFVYFRYTCKLVHVLGLCVGCPRPTPNLSPNTGIQYRYICLSTLGKLVHVLGLCVGCPRPTPNLSPNTGIQYRYICLSTLGKLVHVLGLCVVQPPTQDSQRRSANHIMPYNLCKRDAKDMSTTFEYDNKLKTTVNLESASTRNHDDQQLVPASPT